MIPFHLHHAACGALFVAALYETFRRDRGAAARQFLLPFVVTAFAFGALASYLIGTELSAALHRAPFEPFANKPRPLSAAGYLLCLPVFPLLPGMGLVPVIGRRPVAIAALAVAGTTASWMMIFGA